VIPQKGEQNKVADESYIMDNELKSRENEKKKIEEES
jgi:hypothetical protein